MKIRVLNEMGDLVLTTEKVETTPGIENVKHMTSSEIEKEFNKLVGEGYTPVNEKNNKVVTKFDEQVEAITMLYPVIGG